MLALLAALLAAPILAPTSTAPLPSARSASIPLPGGPPVSMDYLAYDAATDRVWVPAGNTGNVDVVDARTGKVTPIGGFETARVKFRDQERVVGPSAAAVGAGFVYIGNRAGAQVCAVDAHSLEKRGCLPLPSAPDGLAYVATTRELWVTTPREGSVTILDVQVGAAPKLVGRVAIDHAEGFAVDADRGLYYTNLEEQDRTVAVDVRTRQVVATWNPACGKEGPRGLALDTARRHLYVGCASGKLTTLDAGRDGAILGELEVGAGVDNIDFLQATHRLYAAAGRAGTLTVAEAGGSGALRRLATTPAAEGGRVVVADQRGAAYVADSKGGRLLVLSGAW